MTTSRTDRLSHSNFIDLMDHLRTSLALPQLTLSVTSLRMNLETQVANHESMSETDNTPELKPITTSSDKSAAAVITRSINYFVYETECKNASAAAQTIKKRIAAFYISKDQDNIRQNDFDFLPLANAVIQTFYADDSNKDIIMLLPIHQCGAHLGLDRLPAEFLGYTREGFVSALNVFSSFFNAPIIRDHIVLAEVDPLSKQIRVHDSQNTISSLFYLNSLTMNGFTCTYLPHAVQRDSHLCGYYVFAYLYIYLMQGKTDLFSTLNMSHESINSKFYFLKNSRSILDQLIQQSQQQHLVQDNKSAENEKNNFDILLAKDLSIVDSLSDNLSLEDGWLSLDNPHPTDSVANDTEVSTHASDAHETEASTHASVTHETEASTHDSAAHELKLQLTRH